MRILICDDDILIQKQLHKYLNEYFQRAKLKCPEICVYDTGEELLSDNLEKDIVFLDIELPGLSGIYVGNELKRINEKIIIFIITSFSEYLDEAMRFHVFRYLSKPIDRMRLFRNLKDALQLYNSVSCKIPIETKDKTYTLPLSDIVFVEAQGHTITVHTIAKDYQSIRKMAYWTKLLSVNSFFQSHRSFIVNLHYVTDFDHSIIHLYNSQFEAYLTKRKYQQFKSAYFLYLESMR